MTLHKLQYMGLTVGKTISRKSEMLFVRGQFLRSG